MPNQLFEALVTALPAEGEVMTEQRRGAFLRTFDSMLDLVYTEPLALGGGGVPAETLLLEAPALPISPQTTYAPKSEAEAPPKVKPAPKMATVTGNKPAATHTGRHLFRNGSCGKNGCGAIDPRGATDPKHNPFMQPATETSTGPAIAAAAALSVGSLDVARTLPENAIRYCVIQGCHEAIGLGGRCADGHVQGGRA